MKFNGKRNCKHSLSLLLSIENTVQHNYAKFRCGVIPNKMETCRFCINHIPVNKIPCEYCECVNYVNYFLKL